MQRLHQGLGSHVVTLNAEMAMQAEQNPALADVIRKAETGDSRRFGSGAVLADAWQTGAALSGD